MGSVDHQRAMVRKSSPGGRDVLELSAIAKEKLDEYFSDKPKQSIRIYLAAGGCSGPKLALALDDKKDDDDLLEAEGYQFVIQRELLAQAAPLSINANCCGFSIASSLKLSGGCGDGGCCSSGACS